MAVTNSYSTAAKFKAAYGISQSTFDAEIDRAIESASRLIDRHTARRFYYDANASARYYSPRDSDLVGIDDIGTTTGLLVASSNAAGTWTISWTQNDYDGPYGFALEPFNSSGPWRSLRVLSGSFPVMYHGLKVTARWGYATVPVEIEEACLMLAWRLYKRKDAPFGVLENPDTGAVNLQRSDPDIAAILKGHRRMSRVDT